MNVRYKFFILIMLIAVSAYANDVSSPAGLWKTYDDEEKPTGYVRIVEHDGVFTGVIEKGLDNNQEEKYCTKCKDERKGQKLTGMTIIKDVKAKGDGYEGSEILDPFSGNSYHVKLTLKDPNKMEVRGYIGISLFGRTQVWKRAQNEQ